MNERMKIFAVLRSFLCMSYNLSSSFTILFLRPPFIFPRIRNATAPTLLRLSFSSHLEGRQFPVCHSPFLIYPMCFDVRAGPCDNPICSDMLRSWVSHRFAPICTDSHWFAPLRTGSHRFAPVRTDSHRFAPVGTDSHWFTATVPKTAATTTTRANPHSTGTIRGALNLSDVADIIRGAPVSPLPASRGMAFQPNP